eukprot:scaffold625904_cov67-Attheya_sp.AAC.1
MKTKPNLNTRSIARPNIKYQRWNYLITTTTTSVGTIRWYQETHVSFLGRTSQEIPIFSLDPIVLVLVDLALFCILHPPKSDNDNVYPGPDQRQTMPPARPIAPKQSSDSGSEKTGSCYETDSDDSGMSYETESER